MADLIRHLRLSINNRLRMRSRVKPGMTGQRLFRQSLFFQNKPLTFNNYYLPRHPRDYSIQTISSSNLSRLFISIFYLSLV